MKVAILIPVLGSRDAVGADALTMARELADQGIEARIFCQSSIDLDTKTYSPDKMSSFATSSDDVVIYHFSTGWPKGRELLARSPARRIVKYHNITPPHFFSSISSEYQGACAEGRQEIDAIAKLGCELYVGDSAYNLDELVDAGAPREHGAVLPPFHRIENLLDAEADAEMLDQLWDGARNFLMVGRIAPNKGHVELIDAFATYLRAFGEPARLILLGKIDPRLSAYTNAVRSRIASYGIERNVLWINGASEEQLKAAYAASHVFMLMSAHEGFCVPLIEAMAMGTPIVARGVTAVPETLGDAGISWPLPDPLLFAASAGRLFEDTKLRNTVRDAAMRRYSERFSIKQLRADFLQLVERAR